MGIEISQPFQFVAGGIGTTTEALDQVEKHIWAIVSTRFGERVMLPEFGSSAWADLFENLADFTPMLQDELTRALAQWEPRGQLYSVQAVNSNDEGFASGVEVRIAYGLAGFDFSRETTILLGSDMQRAPSGAADVRNL